MLNHSGESDEFGPTLSFRGLDNASYFRLLPEDPSRYVNDMGRGNCLALDRPVNVEHGARRAAALDGTGRDRRFPLRSRDRDRPSRLGLRSARAAVRRRSRRIRSSRKAKLIAEPWDIGPGGYQLGAFPESWGEWNDRFRDTARRFWRGDARMRGELATRLAGSRDVFATAPTPAKSVNFIVAHDGFTLADLVSYSHKHNEANGEDNRDGTNDNYSWNHGVEGPSDDPEIKAARARDMRNLLASAVRRARTPDAGDGLGNRPQPERQQQRLRAGQRDLLDRLGARPTPRSSPSSGASRRCGAPTPPFGARPG